MQPKKIITTPHTTLKEEKLSAFLDTGQRNKGEERGEENYQKKRSKERKKEISLNEFTSGMPNGKFLTKKF